MSELLDYPYLSFFERFSVAPIKDIFILPSSRLFLAYLASSFLIALVGHAVSARTRGTKSNPMHDLLPSSVYLHRSAVVDYWYFMVNAIVSGVLLAPFAGVGLVVTSRVSDFLKAVGWVTQSSIGAPWMVNVLGTLFLVLVADFSSYLVHVWFHRIPWLWEFHKVHHSAEVMTPVTVLRMHPMDDFVTMVVGGVLGGTADAVLRGCIAPTFSPVGLYGITIFTFVFYVFGYNLRHSHIWVSYGPWLSRIFISPAQHQIHHSKAKRHWNKNYGFMFALWDWLFGSLYVPKEQEPLEFGLGTSEDGEYSSVLRLYGLPLVKLYRKYVRPTSRH